MALNIGQFDAGKWLKRFGYLQGVSLDSLSKLDNASRDVRPALEKLQAFFGDEQIGQPDGVLGPLTLRAMTEPRCIHPDFADDEIAGSTGMAVAETLDLTIDEATALVEQHQRMKAVGSGSWPMPCQKDGVTVDINTSAMPKSIDVDRLWKEAVITYGLIGVKLIKAQPGQRANIRVWWTRGRGWIGLAEFNNRSCGDSVFCQLSYTYNPNFFQVFGLFVHELGHNMNLQHTRGGVMNPTIINFGSTVFRYTPSDPSHRTLVRYFGGEPVDTTPPPDDPPPPGDVYHFEGSFRLKQGDRDLGEYILTPKPRI